MRFPKSFICQSLAAAMVLVSHLATEITAGDQHGMIWLVIAKFAMITSAVLVATIYASKRRLKAGSLTTLLAITGMTGVFLMEPVFRQVFGIGHPMEVQLLIGLRNVSLVCLIWSHLPRFENLAALISLFSLLFCVSASHDRSLIWISGAYLILGVCWLSLRYWFSLKTESIKDQRQFSHSWQIAVVAFLLCMGLMSFSTPVQTRLRMVRGMLPSSGGAGQADPFARSGVGDGDAIVAATREARSFAPIEEAPFLEDNQPSLYDMFQDSYGVPKKIKKFERAIAIPPELFNHNHQRMAQAKKASRSFSIDRNRPPHQSKRAMKDTDSQAMLHLAGPVPAHLRHTTYDLFDGFEWYPEQLQEGHSRKIDVEQIDEKPWIRWANFGAATEKKWYDRHALRIVAVDTNRILAPANLQALHIDRCDRPDLFRWEQPDVLSMDRGSLPGMTIIHLVSELVDTPQLIRDDSKLSYGFEEYRSLPVGPRMEEVIELADSWTKGAKTDWEKVCAIRDRLRSEYVHDTQTTIPENCDNPIAWFLFDAKQGPDYLFATSAVTLCRAAGISARGVSGFYANPNHFDFSTQQTSVFPSDIHWWGEVYLGRQMWVTLEPTPGYEVRDVPLTLLAKILMAFESGFKAAMTNWPATLLILLIAGVLFYRRRRILWEIRYWYWRLRYCSRPLNSPQWRALLISTGQLWDQRLILSGKPRPTFRSPAQHLKQEQLSTTDAIAERERLARAFDWAFYSQETTLPRDWEEHQLQQDCLRLIAPARKRRNSKLNTTQAATGSTQTGRI